MLVPAVCRLDSPVGSLHRILQCLIGQPLNLHLLQVPIHLLNHHPLHNPLVSPRLLHHHFLLRNLVLSHH